MSRRTLPRNTVIVGDAREKLATLPARSIDCVITSPPYFQLRDYQVGGQIGLEDRVENWADELCTVMRGIARVLKPGGSVWLNLGDSYSRHPKYGAARKSLLLGGERVALGLIQDGWTIRNKVIWSKTNNMPNSVRDRLSCSWEVVYFLTRSERYSFDLDAIRVPARSARNAERSGKPYPPASSLPPRWAGPLAGSNAGLARLKAEGRVSHPLGKNPSDVWALPAANFRGAHFATFPPALVTRPLLASCPERVCRGCGAPWERQAARRANGLSTLGELQPACECRGGWQPGVVLDPFFGAGTVGLVAEQHTRDWLGIELNPDFVALAEERIAAAREGVMTTNERRSA
jgi:DNA modification methylase